MKPTLSALMIAGIGGASLLGEIAWIRQLDRILGATSLSAVTVIGAFLCGMGIGSGLGAWLTRSRIPSGTDGEGTEAIWFRSNIRMSHLLLAFQMIAAFWAFFSPQLGEIVGAISDRVAPEVQRSGLLLLNSGLSFSVLLVPGVVGGVCLPLMAELGIGTGGSTQREKGLSFLWAWDAIGAASAALLTGVLLIRAFGVMGVFRLEAALHLLLAVIIMRSRRVGNGEAVEARSGGFAAKPRTGVESDSCTGCSRWAVLMVVVAGAATVAWQALWTRVLMLFFSGSVTWPSIVISAWIGGSGLGAMLYLKSDRLSRSSESVLGGSQIASAGATLMVISLGSKLSTVVSNLHPFPWFGDPVWVEMLIGFLIFPAAMLMGLVMPASVAVFLRGDRQRDRSVGEATGFVLAADVIGAMLATFLVPLIWIPALGLHGAIWLVALLQVLSGVLFLGITSGATRNHLKLKSVRYSLLLLCIGVFAMSSADLRPWAVHDLNETGSAHHRAKPVALREIWGASAAAAVVTEPDGKLKLVVDRHHGMGGERGVFIERRQGHIPMLLHGSARNVLVTGIGTGNTLGAVSRHSATRIDGIESLGSVLGMMDLFGKTNHRVWLDKRVRIHQLDGHTFLRRSTVRYDVIITDLVHPWRSGASGLYNLDHLLRLRKKLANGGLFCFWLPLHELDRGDLAVIAATFLEAFKEGRVILGHLGWRQPILALLAGGPEDLLTRERLRPILDGFPAVYAERVDLDTPEDLQSLYIGDTDWLRQIADGAPITTWDKPELAYRSAKTWWKDTIELGLASLADVLAIRRSVQIVAPNDDRAAKRHLAVGMLLRAELAEVRGLTEEAANGYLEAARTDDTFHLPRILLSMLRKKTL